ncbi:MAG: AMP-binding protein, partial [Acidobacteriota bacterium]
KLTDVSGIKGRLLGWARRVGREHADALDHGRKPSAWLARRHGLAERLVLEKIRRRLGLSRTHIAATGAAPIRREILEMFSGLGVRIYEVYGLSETTGPGTWNRNGQTRLGTVGPVIPDVELHIADDGEVLFRGPNVFRGYYKDPAATAEALDEDGWFHTGDLGKVDAEGFLTITGRKKEILVTSGGKNVAPVAIEAKLQELDLVGDAFVVGDGRRFLTALLTVEEEAAARFAAEHGIEASQVPTHDGALGALRKGVTATNGRLARVEGIRNFRVLGRRFSVDGGELTPTLKPRRKIIAERYSVEIEAMYEEGQILEPGAG